MTVLTKPSLTIKKIPLIDESHCDGEIIEMQPTGPRKRHHSLGAIFCMAVTVFLLVLMGVITALQIYEQVTSDVSQHNRIQGFCSIPLNGDMEMLESHRMPLQWKAANVGTTIQVSTCLFLLQINRPPDDKQWLAMTKHNYNNKVRIKLNQVVSVTEDDDPDHLMDLLREVFDIDIDQSVEKISVFNNGHPVSFLHDFEANVTVRKRSADAPPHDYMHFAGNGVQEIEISNLAELLQYEQDNKRTD
ncbi:hypothetical protein HF086_003492 [Spodoptera exigua]|uniref:Integral membrane protein 2 n=1 Tax=Spodoptera exigua TaxID=7107 RepID=A0A922MYF9_SPOEX|nr:hypothetical protein HF086_003492 [Spodoptera exigua]